MKRALTIHALVICVVVVVAAMLVVPVDARGRNRGANFVDITPSRIGLISWNNNDDVLHHGPVGGIHAFSIASTSCNIGNIGAEWIDGVGGRNPVMGQQLYRLKDGRFEQIGLAWVKHAWCALAEPTCPQEGNPCVGMACDHLGPGCADTYWSDLNAGPTRIGPRFQINAQGQGAGGVHNDIYNQPSGSSIAGRLQVKEADITGGGRFFAEIQYVTHDETLDKRFNNASWREMNVTTTSMTGVAVGQASVHRGEPAIEAWRDIDPAVTIVAFEDVPGQGRFNLGYKVTDNGDGTWTYEYALHNQNSDRSAGAFSVPVATGVTVSNLGFHDVDYHSGDGIGYVTQDGTDWLVTIGVSSVEWATESFSRDANANALRWGTLYNFRFTADSPPTTGPITVGLFKPGTPASVGVVGAIPSPVAPACPADLTDEKGGGPDGQIDVFDLFALLAGWDTNGAGANLADPTDVVDVFDLFVMLEEWGACE